MLGAGHHVETIQPRLLNTIVGRNATIGVDGVGMQVGLIDIESIDLRNDYLLSEITFVS